MENDADLNLLRVLNALLEERSVTHAAARLHRSPAAISRALGRLRVQMRDPLLVRSGRELVPTPKAIDLKAQVRQVTEMAEDLFAAQPVEGPTAMNRRFRISAAGAVVAALAQPLVEKAGIEAPGVSFSFVGDDREVEQLRSGEVDLDVGSMMDITGSVRGEVLFEDRFVALLRSPDRSSNLPLTSAELKRRGLVVVARNGDRPTWVSEFAGERSTGTDSEIVVPSYLAAIQLVAKTNRIALVPGTIASLFADQLSLLPVTLPIKSPIIPVTQAWHKRNSNDPGHKWLRDTVRTVVAEVVEPH